MRSSIPFRGVDFVDSHLTNRDFKVDFPDWCAMYLDNNSSRLRPCTTGWLVDILWLPVLVSDAERIGYPRLCS